MRSWEGERAVPRSVWRVGAVRVVGHVTLVTPPDSECWTGPGREDRHSVGRDIRDI